MSIRPILLLGHPGLRVNCTRVKRFGTTDLQSLVTDLCETLVDFRLRNGFGRGIAAPQIGDPLRVIVVDVDTPVALVNPLITRRSRTMMTLWDECFCFPDLAVKVKRHLSIEVRFQDVEGRRHMMKAKGGTAELLQHEIDHINGVLAVDRAVDSRHIVYKSEIEKLKTTKRKGGM
jgi:peptide deformylase